MLWSYMSFGKWRRFMKKLNGIRWGIKRVVLLLWCWWGLIFLASVWRFRVLFGGSLFRIWKFGVCGPFRGVHRCLPPPSGVDWVRVDALFHPFRFWCAGRDNLHFSCEIFPCWSARWTSRYFCSLFLRSINYFFWQDVWWYLAVPMIFYIYDLI